MEEIIFCCPVCGKKEFSDYLEVQDHFLSKEHFLIQKCNFCGFRFINPRPAKSEIRRYYQSDEYISHGVKKNDFLSRIYGIARFFSIKNKFMVVKKYGHSGKLLDVGCGTGEFLSYCHKNGWEVSGVEPNEKARKYAQTKNNISVTDQLSLLNDHSGLFSCITMWHVLEHVHDLDETLETVKNLLTPDGVFVAAVPNSNSWDALKYQGYWAAYDVPRHLYHFTEVTMHTLAARKGFEVLETIPQKLDAYYVSMLSEKYLTGRTNYLKSLIFGIWSNCKAKKKGMGYSSLIFILSLKRG